LKSLAKQLAVLIARILVFPAACLSGFGRWRELFAFFSQSMATVPGIPGSYLRVAYYRWTLDAVGRDCHIGFGSYFAHPQASMGNDVGMGAYCVLGQVDLGDGTLLASHVQILSGSRQHKRAESGKLTDEGRTFRRIKIGTQCWIGAGAIIAADLSDGATVGPGSVVSQNVPAGGTVSGNPARNFAVVVKPAKPVS
jgi:acetyltransferase-like isoleucine patch superfamily enzyme